MNTKEQIFFNYLTTTGEEMKSKFKKGNYVIIESAIDTMLLENDKYKPMRELSDEECFKFIQDYHKSEIENLKPILSKIGQAPTGSIIYNGHSLRHGAVSDFYLLQ